MDTKKIISDEVFKQLKTKEDLTSFFKDLQKRAIECMLEGELNVHLDYDKHDLRKDQNARNGYATKTIKSDLGEDVIKVPRDRDATFNPMIVPKRKNMIDGLENVIVSLYAKGMSVADIEQRIHPSNPIFYSLI